MDFESYDQPPVFDFKPYSETITRNNIAKIAFNDSVAPKVLKEIPKGQTVFAPIAFNAVGNKGRMRHRNLLQFISNQQDPNPDRMVDDGDEDLRDHEEEEDPLTCRDLLSKQQMEQYGVSPNWPLRIVEGKDFDPKDYNYTGFTSETSDFSLYLIRPPKSKKEKMLLVCQHNVETKLCGKIQTGFFKFFQHVRTHTNEHPFTCKYENCDHKFTQMSSLKQHMCRHLDIKKVVCLNCNKRFIKNYELNLHLQSKKGCSLHQAKKHTVDDDMY